MGEPNWTNQTIWTGDCLDILRGMNSASVDLVYLDPPFNSKANYAAPIGSKAAGAAFKDTWTLSDVDVEWINLIEAKHPALYRVLLAAMTGSDKSYLVYMAARMLELHRVLKPTGSIYLHCDPKMSHYLKLVMDSVFGPKYFRNEITWHYRKWSTGKYDFQKNHDILLFYGPQRGRTFNQLYMERAPSTLKRFGKGKIVSGFDESGQRLPSITEGESFGVRQDDVWQIRRVPPIKQIYLTQKPLALLDRIVKASSNPGDMVLDPFCGCATACIAAEQRQRLWVGIDISPKAAELVRQRMNDELGMFYDGAHRTDIPIRTDLGELPRYNSPENRTRLYGEQSGNCAGCKDHFEARHLEVDHIIARLKGVDRITPDNLQLLCGNCNRIKGRPRHGIPAYEAPANWTLESCPSG